MSNVIVPPQKKFSWTSVIAKVEVGSEMRASETLATTIRPLISGRIKLLYPERVFETRTQDGFIIIKRTA